MKYIRNLFLLGLFNFTILVTVLLAADFVKSRSTITPIPISPQYQVIPTVSPSVTKTLPVGNIKSSTPTTVPTTKTKSTPTPQLTTQPTPTVDVLAGKCLIYISGIRYDMTDFRKIHGGGDIFQCGTDMTAIFNDQHPASYIDRIAKYKI